MLALTPAGAGFLSLFSPGLLVAAVTGQRLLIALSIGAGMLVAVNAVAAWLAVRGVEIHLRGPATATVGEPVPIRVVLDGRRPLRCVIGVEGATRPWAPAIVPATGDVLVVPSHRGLIERIETRIQSPVPLGLTAWVRAVPATLAWPIHVGPPAVPVVLPVDLRASMSAPSAAADPSEPAGLRDYASGDPVRDIHWPAVARTGKLVVKDRSRTVDLASVQVTIDAGVEGNGSADGDYRVALDGVLGRARSVVEQLLTAGYRINLVTVEPADQGPDPVARAGSPNGAVMRWRDRRQQPLPVVAVAVSGPILSWEAIATRLALACAGRPDLVATATSGTGASMAGELAAAGRAPAPGPAGPAGRAELVITPGELRWHWPS
jgi:uncharacterized protein (DUF58 family)